MVTVVSCLRLGKLAFERDALVRLVGALDAILVARKLFDHFEDTTWHLSESPTWHIPTDYRCEGNDISDLEFAGRHRVLPFGRDSRWRSP